MRIALVAFRFPYPLFGGGSSRAFHQIDELVRRGHKVRLVTPQALGSRSAEAHAAVASMCEQVEYYRMGGRHSARNMLTAPFRDQPLQTSMQWTSSGRRALGSVLADGQVDILHTQLIRTAPAERDAPRKLGRVLDLIDALSLNLARRASAERSPLGWLVAHEAGRVRRYERSIIDAYDEVLITSASDRGAIGDPRISVVPMGVDVAAQTLPATDVVSGRVVFTGAMWYFPNQNAVTWFVEHIWPRVQAQISNATFMIVGDRPSRAVERLASHPGVTVTGHVASVEDVLRTASVAVAPMRAGSGMQTKVLAAMANTVPVVATSYVLDGISAIPGEHLVVADEPDAFADAVVALLNDAGKRRCFGLAGQRFVAERYSWRHSVDLLERAYERARQAGAARMGVTDSGDHRNGS